MRLGVVDIGSSAVNLLITDMRATTGDLPLAASAWKARTRLALHIRAGGTISSNGVRIVIGAVVQALGQAAAGQVDELFTYATAAVRDAPNGADIIQSVREATGCRLTTLSGVQEAQLTYLAARRWMGWRAGSLMLLDIGGGTSEVAFGRDRLPETALSLPLGAGRLTREFLQSLDIPSAKAVRRLRQHVHDQVSEVIDQFGRQTPHTAVAASTIFQQLARLAGAPPLGRGPFVERRLQRSALPPWIKRLAATPAGHRARLQGVSTHRAEQILAGAIVGYELMLGFNVSTVTLCPWGLREGILLSRLEDRPESLGTLNWTTLRERT